MFVDIVSCMSAQKPRSAHNVRVVNVYPTVIFSFIIRHTTVEFLLPFNTGMWQHTLLYFCNIVPLVRDYDFHTNIQTPSTSIITYYTSMSPTMRREVTQNKHYCFYGRLP